MAETLELTDNECEHLRGVARIVERMHESPAAIDTLARYEAFNRCRAAR